LCAILPWLQEFEAATIVVDAYQNFHRTEAECTFRAAG
jgi:hypothetical protein